MKSVSEHYFYISETEYDETKKGMFDFHYHDCYEMYYLFSGKRRYLINCNLFDVDAGDIILIKKNELHMTKRLDEPFGNNMKIYMNDKTLQSLGLGAEKFKECFKYNHISLPIKQKNYVSSIFSKIRKEYKDKTPFSKQLTQNLVYELLVYIYRFIFTEQGYNFDLSKSQSNEINKAIKYIYTNYNKKLSLTEIAEYVHMNPTYFSRHFKMSTGINLTDYINIIRIKHATNLIKSTNMTLTEIAHACGYNEQAYFCKQFKKINGCTAREFKKL